MDPRVARAIAESAHAGQRIDGGELRIAHLERIAAHVPPDAQAIAWLHELLEHTDITARELHAQGLTHVELRALDLLSRLPGEDYELHTLRIAYGRGAASDLARVVRLADVEDDPEPARDSARDVSALRRWAHRHLVGGQARRPADVALS